MSDEEDFMCEEDESSDDGMDSDGLPFSGGEEEQDSAGRHARPPTTFQTLSPDDISKKMFEIIDEVNAVFQVSHSIWL